MKPTASPLKILDFAITKLDFELVFENAESAIIEYFNSYDLDIDFDMYKNEDLKVFIRIKVNRSTQKLPGYSFSAEAACIFAFEHSEGIDEQQKREMEGFSTIYIALNSLRGLISNFTANAPFGRYILPSIDLNDLIQKKQQILAISNKNDTSKSNPQKAIKKSAKSKRRVNK